MHVSSVVGGHALAVKPDRCREVQIDLVIRSQRHGPSEAHEHLFPKAVRAYIHRRRVRFRQGRKGRDADGPPRSTVLSIYLLRVH